MALSPYHPPLPALPLNHVLRLGAAILRTFDRLGVCAGKEGVSFARVRLHRGEFLSFALTEEDLTTQEQSLICEEATRQRLQALIPQPLAIIREADQILIVIDLRQHPKTWRARVRHWLRHAKQRRGYTALQAVGAGGHNEERRT
jgi:hypothetical protein